MLTPKMFEKKLIMVLTLVHYARARMCDVVFD